MDLILQIVLFACIADMVLSVPTPAQSQSRFEPEIPEECSKQGYCENIPNYPKDHVRKLIEELGEDFVERNFQTEKLDTEIALRDGDGINTVGLCNLTEKIIVPELLRDLAGIWWTVLQYTDKNITQSFQAGTCNTDAVCSDLIEPRWGYQYKCKQQHSSQMVFVLDKTGTRVIQHPQLQVPTCCSCFITIPSADGF